MMSPFDFDDCYKYDAFNKKAYFFTPDQVMNIREALGKSSWLEEVKNLIEEEEAKGLTIDRFSDKIKGLIKEGSNAESK